MNIHDAAESRKTTFRHLLDFTADSNPLGPSSGAKAAIRKEIGNVDRPPDERTRYLRAYLSRVEGVEGDRIVFGAGSTHLLDLLLEATRPATAGVLSPFSPRLTEVLSRRCVTVEPLIPEGGRMSPVPLRMLCDRIGGLDMLLLSNPHDTTGAVLSAGDMGVLIEEAACLGKILVIDEGLRDYGTFDSPVQEVVSSSTTIILRTFSFFHALQGLRIGYSIGAAGLVRQMEERMPSLRINSLAPRAALASLKDRRYRERTLRFILDEKAYMKGKLSGLKGVEILDTPLNFILLGIRKEWEDLYKSFLDRNILISGWSGPDGTALIRVPVRSHKSNAHFARAMRVITGG